MTKQTVRNPHNLPTKICLTCRLPFTWRKKWERNWESVRYCSDKCRQSAPKQQRTESTNSPDTE